MPSSAVLQVYCTSTVSPLVTSGGKISTSGPLGGTAASAVAVKLPKSVSYETAAGLAEAKGLSQRRVMFSYAARNALLPSVTAFGMALGFVISGALVTEVVFAYPGLGYSLLTAVRQLDYPLMQGIFLMITLAVLVANLIVDILYVRLDPRVRTG